MRTRHGRLRAFRSRNFGAAPICRNSAMERCSGLLSVDISDWTTPGNKTTAKVCLTMHQPQTKSRMRSGLSSLLILPPPSIRSLRVIGMIASLIHLSFFKQEESRTLSRYWSTLLAPGELPGRHDGDSHCFLASDYVRTNTDLATMESANEAARRGLQMGFSWLPAPAEPKSDVWQFPEPAVFQPLKDIDRFLFEKKLPHPGSNSTQGPFSSQRER